MNEAPLWPRKTRELQGGPLDSTIWNNFAFRDGDIIIATYPKSGTTWMQQIVAQLLFGGDPDLEVYSLCPWLDLPFFKAENLALLEAQTHRRFIKTHLPADALVLSPRARYLYIGRDGRDVVWSLSNHFASYKEASRLRQNWARSVLSGWPRERAGDSMLSYDTAATCTQRLALAIFPHLSVAEKWKRPLWRALCLRQIRLCLDGSPIPPALQ